MAKNDECITAVYSFRGNKKLMKKISHYAALHDLPVSEIIRDALQSYVPIKKYLAKK